MSTANLQNIGLACKGLNNHQLKLILSTKGLGTEQRKTILEGMGLEKQERAQKLATLGFAAAEDKATVSTFSLKGAFRSLGTAIAANPIGIIVTAATVATMVFTGFKRAVEEARQKAKELGESFNNTKAEIKDYKSQIEELNRTINANDSSVEDVANARKSLLSIQNELIDKFGTEKDVVEDVTKAINGQADALDKFALNSIDILSICDSINARLDELKGTGITADYSSYENFVSVLGNTESTAQDVETAFDSLATSITRAVLTGKEDFATMKAALEDLGVVNNEIVAFDALISNTSAQKEAGLDLADATDEQVQEFAEAMVSAENYGQAVNLLRMQKILCNENPLSTAGDINELYQLAQAAGIATEAIQQLMGLNSAYEMAAESGNTIAMTAVRVQMDMVRKQVVDQFSKTRQRWKSCSGISASPRIMC